MSTEKDNTTKQRPVQTDEHEEVVLRRRRLLKGAAAAPMVLTLFSGAAVAARTSTVVIQAQSLDEAIDETKGVIDPICVDGVEPIDPPPEYAYHVEGTSQPFSMDDEFKVSPEGQDVPLLTEVDQSNPQALFDWYTRQCDQQGGIVIVASSSTSLTH